MFNSVQHNSIQHNSHLERPCVFLSGKRPCEWFWVCSEAACGLSVSLGPCLIQRCWNHFICPSPLCWGNYTCVSVPRSPETRRPARTVSGCIISAVAHPLTRPQHPLILLLRHNAGVKGSCQSCSIRAWGPRIRALYMVWKTSELVQSRKKIPSRHFSFETFHGKKHAGDKMTWLEKQQTSLAEEKRKTRSMTWEVTEVKH